MSLFFSRYYCALGAILATTVFSAGARADVIGINFVGANNGGGATVDASAGVIAQTNWNNESGGTGTDSGIILSDGSTAGATLTWSANDPWATGGAGQNANGDLMQGYLDDLSTRSTTVTLSDLPASIAGTGSTAYTVYLYIAGDTAGRGGPYTVNGQTAVLVNSGPAANGVFQLATAASDDSGTGAVDGNYYVFTNVTGTTLTITTTPSIGGANERTPIDGIQVVSGSVPEPASLTLLSAAVIPLILRRRRGGSR